MDTALQQQTQTESERPYASPRLLAELAPLLEGADITSIRIARIANGAFRVTATRMTGPGHAIVEHANSVDLEQAVTRAIYRLGTHR